MTSNSKTLNIKSHLLMRLNFSIRSIGLTKLRFFLWQVNLSSEAVLWPNGSMGSL